MLDLSCCMYARRQRRAYLGQSVIARHISQTIIDQVFGIPSDYEMQIAQYNLRRQGISENSLNTLKNGIAKAKELVPVLNSVHPKLAKTVFNDVFISFASQNQDTIQDILAADDMSKFLKCIFTDEKLLYRFFIHSMENQECPSYAAELVYAVSGALDKAMIAAVKSQTQIFQYPGKLVCAVYPDSAHECIELRKEQIKFMSKALCCREELSILPELLFNEQVIAHLAAQSRMSVSEYLLCRDPADYFQVHFGFLPVSHDTMMLHLRQAGMSMEMQQNINAISKSIDVIQRQSYKNLLFYPNNTARQR